MKWSNKKPEAPGWYWYREEGRPACMAHIMSPGDDEPLLALYETDAVHWQSALTKMPGQFAGPIPEPVESTVTDEMVDRVMSEDGQFGCPVCDYTGHWSGSEQMKRAAIRSVLRTALDSKE